MAFVGCLACTLFILKMLIYLMLTDRERLDGIRRLKKDGEI